MIARALGRSSVGRRKQTIIRQQFDTFGIYSLRDLLQDLGTNDAYRAMRCPNPFARICFKTTAGVGPSVSACCSSLLKKNVGMLHDLPNPHG